MKAPQQILLTVTLASLPFLSLLENIDDLEENFYVPFATPFSYVPYRNVLDGLVFPGPTIETFDEVNVTVQSAVEWLEGRSTFYDGIDNGSCGYGPITEDLSFSRDAIVAIPDVHPDFPGACGRCYEVKCRPTDALPMEGGGVEDRMDACIDESLSVIVQVVDTCPCADGAQFWCCGDMDHFDLSTDLFAKIADPTAGVIGISYRPVPCYEGDELPTAENPVSQYLYNSGFVGQGWVLEKFDYEDFDLRAPGMVQKEMALCAVFNIYGGVNFVIRDGAQPSFIDGKLSMWMKGALDVRVTVVTGETENILNLDEFPENSPEGGWNYLSASLADFGIPTDTEIDRVTLQNIATPDPNFCIASLVLVENTPL